MKRLFIFLLFLFNGAFNLQAQTTNTVNKLPQDFTNFFIGTWTGSGEFANGRKISADLSFKISLDSCWILSQHTDKLPNSYKALSMWGIDLINGRFLAYTFDNFHGHREFESGGWKDGKLILTTNEFNKQGLRIFQHFIYARLSANSFKMTFEISRDSIIWKLGDYLIFNRIGG